MTQFGAAVCSDGTSVDAGSGRSDSALPLTSHHFIPTLPSHSLIYKSRATIGSKVASSAFINLKLVEYLSMSCLLCVPDLPGII